MLMSLKIGQRHCIVKQPIRCRYFLNVMELRISILHKQNSWTPRLVYESLRQKPTLLETWLKNSSEKRNLSAIAMLGVEEDRSKVKVLLSKYHVSTIILISLKILWLIYDNFNFATLYESTFIYVILLLIFLTLHLREVVHRNMRMTYWSLFNKGLECSPETRITNRVLLSQRLRHS